VLDGAGEDAVGEAGKGAGRVELAVAEGGGAGGVGGEVALLEGAARVVEGAELDGDAGADADEGRESAFVEGRGAFVAEDGGRAREGRGVGCGCLEADFDYVW
jgi:hypothetical protein